MRKLWMFFLVCSMLRCQAGVLDADTIDNWQIYNNDILLLAGNAVGENFEATISKKHLGVLAIKYNHCSRYHDLDVTVDVLNEYGLVIISRKFKTDSGMRMVFDKSDFDKIGPGLLTIRYTEKNGINITLGTLHIT